MSRDAWPTADVDDLLQSLSGAKHYSALDLFSGCWQIRLDERVKDLTSFCCEFGAYRFEVMPFGLQNAPAVFQRMMTALLEDLPFVRVHLDDVIVFSTTLIEHLTHLGRAFDRINKHGLKLKVKKRNLTHERARALGHIVSQDGIECDESKIEKIQSWKRPATKGEALSFVSLRSRCRKLIKNFACLAKPLCDAQKEKNFAWAKSAELSFNLLKEIISSPPILARPGHTRPLKVRSDACGHGIGAILAQVNVNGQERPVAHASRGMPKAEGNYGITGKEGLAAIFALKKLRHFLLPRPFELVVDHQALKCIFTKSEATGRLARWLTILSEFRVTITYRKGSRHKNVDALSRRPVIDAPREQHRRRLGAIIGECRENNIGVCDHIKEYMERHFIGVSKDGIWHDRSPGADATASNKAMVDKMKAERIKVVTEESDNINCKGSRRERMGVKDMAMPITMEDVEFDVEDEIKEVIQHLKGGVTPGFREGESTSWLDRARSVSRKSQSCKKINNVLYRVAKGGLRVALGRSERYDILKLLHDELGHFDGEPTHLLAKARAWWPR